MPRLLSPLIVAMVLAAGIGLLPGAARAVPPSSAISYAYDELGRLVAVSDPGNGAAKYSYDAVGNVTAITRQATSVVSVLGFSPRTAPVGSAVTIYGTGYSSTPSQNTVQFNGTNATVSSATATQLVVTVPSGATTGPIGVTSPTGNASSSASFTLGAGAPTITSFQPTIGVAGAAVTITGSNFETTAANDQVGFGLVRSQTPTSASQTSLQTTVPGSTGTGHVSVVTPSGRAESTGYLFVPPGSYTASDVAVTDQMTIGQAKTVTIGAANKVALVAFDAAAGQRVFLNTTNVTIGSSSCCSATLSIYDPYNGRVAGAVYVGTSGGYINTSTLPTAGSYAILVDPEGTATGSITLNLSNVPADASGTITPGGAPVTLTAGSMGQNGKLTFSGTQGNRISLRVTTTIGSGAACSVNVSILNPDGSTLVPNQCASKANGVFIDATSLTQTGTYTIAGDPIGTGTGDMTFTLYDVPPDSTGTITIGGPPVTVTLATPGQNGTRTFSGSSGQAIRLQLTNVTIGTPTVCGSKVIIKRPDGSTQAQNTCVTTAGATINTTLTQTGTHTILVDPQSYYTGSMTLTLSLQGSLALHARADQSGFSTPAALVPQANPPPQASPPAPDFDPPGAEEWVPDAQNRRGYWRSDRPQTPWRTLPPLLAGAGVTAVSGQALTLQGRPLANVTLEVEDTDAETKTDDSGRFLITDLEPGHHVLVVDGESASTPGKRYGLFEIGIDLEQGKTTVLETTWMPRLDTAHAVKIAQPTSSEVVVTTPRIPGLELHIPAGTTITDEEGAPVTEVGITAIPVERPPFPLPLGAEVPVYFTIQPGGAYLSKGAQLLYPNYSKLPPGQRVAFWQYDPEEKGWFIYGMGTVTPDAKQVVPDPGVKIYAFNGAMISTSPIPPLRWPKFPWPFGGDPVDLGSGLFVYEKTDLTLPGMLPLVLTRTYRQEDSNSYAFGKGATVSFDLRLWSNNNFQEADLILPDGGRVHYVRVSPGTGNVDAVYEAQATPTVFYKSRISWNGAGWNLKLTDGTLLIFGDLSPLQAIRDRNGNQITIKRAIGSLYNSCCNITQVTGPSGRWITFTYDANSRITQAQDSSGRTVSYGYDGSGRLTSATDAKGGVSQYTYDGSHRMLTVRDPRNITYLTNEYDANGRVFRQTLADSAVYHFAYTLDGSGNVTQTDATDPRGNIRRVTFNADGYALSDTHALGAPEAQTTSFTRQSGTNLVTSVTDALNRRTDYAYDAKGHVTSITRLAGTGNAVTTSFGYEPSFGLLASVTDPLSHTTSFSYDSKGNLTAITGPLGNQTTIAYDDSGRPASITDALNHSTTLGYALGDLVSVSDALGNKASRFLDGAGRVVSASDGVGNLRSFQYSALNELTRITDAKGGQTQMAYDGNGNLIQLTDARSNATTFTYDSMDRLATRRDPLLREESYAYDAAGNLTLFTDRKGQKSRFAYDPLDRRSLAGFGTAGTPPNETYTSTITYSYDGGDRLTQAVDSLAGTITDSYDGLDRLTQETTAQGSVSYSYDNASRQTGMTVTGQPQVAYGYDNADRLTSVSQGSASVAFAYDNADRRTSLTLPSGILEQYAYDNADRLSSITYKLGQTTLGDLAYDYDRGGQRSAVWGSYARAGLPTAVGSASYDAANQLTSWAGQAISHDANGSLTGDGTTTYSWNDRRELASLSKTGLNAGFSYDAFGRRKAQTTNGTTTSYLYDGRNVVQELQGATPTANLVTGLSLDETFRRTDSAGARDLLTDALGTTVALADASGSIQTSYTYEPFGKATTSGASSANPFQYTGREADASELLYLRARYYSPTLQRFISEDPIGFAGGDPNLYAYVGNSPTIYVDPTGEFLQLAGACLGGAIFNYFVESLSGRKYTPSDAASGCAAGVIGRGLLGPLTRPLAPKAGPPPTFITRPNGETIIVPRGATGPRPVASGKGFQFSGGSGGYGLDPRVTGVRIMDPTLPGVKYPYPSGYVSYFNKEGQAVNPFTGQTIGRADPFWHWR